MKRLIVTHKRELSVAAAYGVLLALLAVVRPAFFSSEFAGIWIHAAPTLVVAVGMTLVIICRHIDISIGSQFSVCCVVAGLTAKLGLPMPLVLAVTLFTGVLLGSINGVLVAYAALPSIVVTLSTMVVLREALRLGRQGEAVRDLPADFQWFGLGQTGGEWVLLLTAAVVMLMFAWAMQNLAGVRAVFAVGSDVDAARLAGIRPRRVTFGVFTLAGLLVALGAFMNAVRFPQVDVNTGSGLELEVIAAVVVGGTAINGGRGTLFGTFVGVALLLTIGPALTFMNLPAQWERAVQGLIILAAVGSDRLIGRDV